MYVYELVTKYHKDFGRNHWCDLRDLSLGDPAESQVIFIGNLRKDRLDSSGRLWEDCTVYDVYIEPNVNPDQTMVLVQFAGGDECNLSMDVRGIEQILEATNGNTERSMLYAYALRLLQHHRSDGLHPSSPDRGR